MMSRAARTPLFLLFLLKAKQRNHRHNVKSMGPILIIFNFVGEENWKQSLKKQEGSQRKIFERYIKRGHNADLTSLLRRAAQDLQGAMENETKSHCRKYNPRNSIEKFTPLKFNYRPVKHKIAEVSRQARGSGSVVLRLRQCMAQVGANSPTIR